MADPVWKIGERGGPSPRAYRLALAAYHASYSSWVRRVLAQVEAANPVPPMDIVTALVSGSPPQPPSVARLVTVNLPAAQAASRVARRGIPRALLDQAGIPPIDLSSIETATLRAWAADGLGYVQAIPAERLPVLADRLTQRVIAGDRWETIREIVSEELGADWPRLDLIAQDQVAKLNGRVTEALQQEAGITSYTWRASRDGRVRATHRAVDGLVWTWAEGAPDVGFYGERSHPGQAGRCRCTAEPVLPEWFRADSCAHGRRLR